MPSLEVSHSIEDVDQALDMLLSQQRPGFQVDPAVGIEPTLAHLESQMTRIVDGFKFNFEYNAEVQNGGSTWHVDTQLTSNRSGIGVHHTTLGSGYVALRLLKPDAQYFYPLEGGWVRNRAGFVGRKYVGQLAVGVVTVFSEGIRSPSLEHEIGPTVHKFRSYNVDKNNRSGTEPNRAYTLYSWDPRKKDSQAA